MSGRGSPRRKLSCSVISGDLDRQAGPDRSRLYAAADPPASGRCPTARGPSVGPRWQSLDRPHVLLSVLSKPLCKSDQGANSWALRPLGGVRPVALEPEGPSNIHVCPLGPVFDGRLGECRRGNGAADSVAGAVPNLRDLYFAVDAVLVRS